jgi:hypothetical protein
MIDSATGFEEWRFASPIPDGHGRLQRGRVPPMAVGTVPNGSGRPRPAADRTNLTTPKRSLTVRVVMMQCWLVSAIQS